MKFIFEGRESDSPFVETIWRTQMEQGGFFTSLAESYWGMIITRQYGKTWLTVRGPETIAMPAPVPENAEAFGIVFKLGTYMPHLPARNLINQEIHLPETSTRSFWLQGAVWQFPSYENIETFVGRLVREGLLVQDRVVAAALQDKPQDVSIRTVRRHFLHSTGLTHQTIRRTERARWAMRLLEQGASIVQTVQQAGYVDQPHMTRELKRLIGQTPGELIRENNPE